MSATTPRAAEELVIRELDGEAVVYDARDGQLHHLDLPAALLLDLCAGTATMEQMATEISSVYGLPQEKTAKQVRQIVRGLRRRNLLIPLRAQPHAAVEEERDERPTIRLGIRPGS